MAKAHDRLEKLKEYIMNHFEYVDGDIIIKKHRHKKRVGKSIGGIFNKDGYKMVSILDRYYRRGRVIFLMKNGFLPPVIDHINRIKNDDRIENLRPASFSENLINNTKPKRKNVTSKYRGVSFDSSRGKWIASINFKNKAIFIGRFNAEIEAAVAYDKKCKELYGDYHCANI